VKVVQKAFFKTKKAFLFLHLFPILICATHFTQQLAAQLKNQNKISFYMRALIWYKFSILVIALTEKPSPNQRGLFCF